VLAQSGEWKEGGGRRRFVVVGVGVVARNFV